MRKLTKILAVLALTVALGAVMALPAAATVYLDFNISGPHPSTAYITYPGTTGSVLTANDLRVNYVQGIATPLNSGIQYDITGGDLDFSTGILTGGGGNTWVFGGGGSLTLTGAIPSMGINSSVPLVSGTFGTCTVIGTQVVINNIPVFQFDVAIGGFTDNKDAELLEWFGLPGGTYTGNFNISFYSTMSSYPSGFSALNPGAIGSGDLTNIPTVPVPPTVLLLGSGILGIVAWGWRRGRKED